MTNGILSIRYDHSPPTKNTIIFKVESRSEIAYLTVYSP